MIKRTRVFFVCLTLLLIIINVKLALAQSINLKDINISLKSSSTGKSTNLRAFADGHYAILVFFSTECPLCNMQLPAIERLHLTINGATANKSSLPPIRLIAIAFDTWGEKSVEPFMKENKYSFDVWYDPMARKTNKLFKIDKDGIPATFIFKPDGTLLKRAVGLVRELDNYSLKLIVEDAKST